MAILIPVTPVGTFMNKSFVMDYFKQNSITACEEFWDNNIFMEGKWWMRTEIVSEQMSAQAFREMECIVPTWFKNN